MKNIVLAITESGDEDIFLLPPHLSLPPFSLILVEGKERREEKEKARTIRKSIEVTEEVVEFVSSSPHPRHFLSLLSTIEEGEEEKK